MATFKDIKEMNVLVVDDEDKICEIIQVFLGTLGPFKSVVKANNSLQAMQKFQNQNFDLLILEIGRASCRERVSSPV